jgi:HTH-type transcriptional regulator/antitoxin HigA
MMDYRIKTIKNNTDYDEALAFLEELIILDPDEDTDEAEQLAVLSVLIENYETNNFPMDIPCAVDAIKFRMDQLDLKPGDLAPYLGSASRASEILSGKRSLTVDMINALSTGFEVRPERR